MKFKKQFLIGIISIVGLFIIVVGSYFLKGQELWKSRYVYYSKFTNTEGLTTGRPVNLNGLKVGIITNVKFDPQNFNSILVEFKCSKTSKRFYDFTELWFTFWCVFRYCLGRLIYFSSSQGYYSIIGFISVRRSN